MFRGILGLAWPLAIVLIALDQGRRGGPHSGRTMVCTAAKTDPKARPFARTLQTAGGASAKARPMESGATIQPSLAELRGFL